MSKKIYIDTDECIGCESCVELCPEVFGFDEDEEKAYVIMPEGGPEECIEEALEAMESVPTVKVFRWFKDNIGQSVQSQKKEVKKCASQSEQIWDYNNVEAFG